MVLAEDLKRLEKVDPETWEEIQCLELRHEVIKFTFNPPSDAGLDRLQGCIQEGTTR
jgi:hypothetical protein